MDMFSKDESALHVLSESDYVNNPPRLNYDQYTEKVDPQVLKKYMEFPDRKITADLVESIKKHGIRNTLILDYDQHSHKALLVEGNHRLLAAIQLGLKWVPVTVLRVNETGLSPHDNIESNGTRVPKPFKADRHGYVPGNIKPSDLGIPSMGKAMSTPKHDVKFKDIRSALGLA